MAMLKLFGLLSLLCGVLYPLLVTVLAQVLFPLQANGSLLQDQGQVIGSSLLAQSTSQAGLFWPRPSPAHYATVASGASNLSPTHAQWTKTWQDRRLKNPAAGVDDWTSSGSGLDPHLSPASALAQIPRIAAARGLPADTLKKLVAKHTETATWGIWGQPRVNVLELNLAITRPGKHEHTAR